MADGPVVLAILDHVSKDADRRLAVPVGLADGEASSLRFSEAAARCWSWSWLERWHPCLPAASLRSLTP
jgi:hypothetical protein